MRIRREDVTVAQAEGVDEVAGCWREYAVVSLLR